MRRIACSTVLFACLLTAAPAAAGTPPLAPAASNTDETPVAAFTDSTAAQLAGTKRVAITSVVLAFQSSTGAIAGPGMFFRMFQPKDEVLSVMAIPNMDADMQDAISEIAYKKLATELKAQVF